MTSSCTSIVDTPHNCQKNKTSVKSAQNKRFFIKKKLGKKLLKQVLVLSRHYFFNFKNILQ